MLSLVLQRCLHFLPLLPLTSVQKEAKGRTTRRRVKETANLDHRLRSRVSIRISILSSTRCQLIFGAIFTNDFTNAKSATPFRSIPAMLEVVANLLTSALAAEVPSLTMSAGASPTRSTETRQCVHLSRSRKTLCRCPHPRLSLQ